MTIECWFFKGWILDKSKIVKKFHLNILLTFFYEKLKIGSWYVNNQQQQIRQFFLSDIFKNMFGLSTVFVFDGLHN